jgi:polysaccharide biosynthesis PFTS motif protein
MKILAYFPIISKYIDRRQRSRLRVINKGYRQIKKEGKLDFPLRLKNILSKVKLDDLDLSKSLLRQNDFNVELSIRQYLTERILGLSFNKSILYSIGSNTPLRHPLPLEWRNALIEQGVEVDNLQSDLLWKMYGLVYWARGALYGLRSAFLLSKKNSRLGNYVYFSDLNDQCISNNINSNNILNWYLQWSGRAEEIDSICHSVNGVSNGKLGKFEIIQTDGLPYITSMDIFRYGMFVIYASIYSFVYSFFQPINGFFLTEILKTKRIDLANCGDLARDYLFHNSTPFYRPIWTYFAEEKGSRILFYFYSTNNENFKTINGYPVQSPWHLINWPHYLVWDEYQTSFIKRFDSNNAVIEEVGNIWFSSSDSNFIVNLESAIAVFDVTPVKQNFYIKLGQCLEFYTPKVANQFLNDIQVVLAEKNYFMIHKMKRTNPMSHESYNKNIKKLKDKDNYSAIEPDLDAVQLTQKTEATISMPFTSTAIIAKLNGKPSVYYDPSGLIQKDDRAAHGIPVLSNIDELEEWVKSIGNE